MGISNEHFYDVNAATAYPVDESASCAADGGGRLPSNILVDLYVAWPSTLGQYAFVSDVTVTPKVVTVIVQASQSPTDAVAPAVLATLTLTQPVDQGRVHRMAAQVDGVDAQVVFGKGVDDGTYRGRFSTPAQSLLSARVCDPYDPLPVSSIQVQNSSSVLTGVVSLRGEPPIEVVAEQREVDGVLRTCAVVRLVDDANTNTGTAVAATSEPSVFEQMAGPCGGRPESGTCGDPQPIQLINNVGPDCNGVITIQLDGCATAAPIITDSVASGLAVDCGLGLVDACLPPQLPDESGVLPDEYTPRNIPTPTPPSTPPATTYSQSYHASGELPFVECFASSDPGSAEWPIASGLWGWSADESPDSPCGHSESLFGGLGSATSMTAATRNVMLWNGFDVSTMYRKVTVDALLSQGPTGAAHNAGVVVNYRPHATIPGYHVYYLVEFDYDAQELRVGFFNGVNVQNLVPVRVPGITLGQWHRLVVEVTADSTPPWTIHITASLQSLANPGVSASTVVAVNDYLPANGSFGLHADRALTSFAYFRVEGYL